MQVERVGERLKWTAPAAGAIALMKYESDTPSLAIAPGTASRYHAKSSPPMLCSVSVSASRPSAERTAARCTATAAAAFTTGGRPRV